jgi:hypothetical protein
MKLNTITLAALAFGLSLSPSLAFAHPVTAHQRPNLFHDRSPKIHSRESVAHH